MSRQIGARRGAGGGAEGDEAPSREGASRWSNRHGPARERQVPERETTPAPAPSRNPEQGWGAVLLAAGGLVTVAATALAYAVLSGGVLGLISAGTATGLAGLLALVGAAGLVQGWRAYRGR